MSKQGRIFLLSGPPGSGKSTIAERVRRDMPHLAYSVSLTTRPPRPGEVDGVHYHFVSRQEFNQALERGEIAEHAQIFGNLYGTSEKAIRAQLDQGRDLFLDTDVDGAAQLRKRFPDGTFIFLLPPSHTELERRLRGRGTEDEDQVRNRLARFEYEVGRAKDYTHIVVNQDLDKAVAQVEAIIKGEPQSEELRTERQQGFIRRLLES